MLLAALLTGVVMLGLLVWQLAIPRTYFTGTDSAGVNSIIATVSPGQEICLPGLDLPAGTGGVRVALFAQLPSVRARISVSTGSGTVSSIASAPTAGTRASPVASIPTTPSHPATRRATVCVSPLGAALGVGGTANVEAGEERTEMLDTITPPVAGGATHAGTAAPALVAGRMSIWFMPPHEGRRDLFSQLGAIFSRAALFRPGVVGPWTYPVLLFLVLPLTWLLALWLLYCAATLRRPRLRGRALRVGWLIGVIAFVNAGSWALITPAFDSPDEPDHFAYVQYLAETGHTPSKVGNAQAPYSTEQTLAMNGVFTYDTISNSEARPPWLKSDERTWERLRAQVKDPSRSNGGGYTPAAAIHDPPYYALGAIAYLLVRSQSVFSQLTMIRLVSALLGALVAMCAFGVVREILPRRPIAAVAAGLLVVFQPMFGFISGAINDDSGVNAAAAVSLYLLVRMLRRGVRWREAVGLGLALALAPLMKETGYEIYPAAAVGVAGLLWREVRARPSARAALRRLAPWLALAGSFVGVLIAWALIKPHVLNVEPGGKVQSTGGISATGSVSLAEHMPGRFLNYLWQLFLPPLPGMGHLFPPGWPFFQVYIERGWASFGWYTFEFPRWVYEVIVLTMALMGALALRAAWRHRRFVWRLGWELALVILFPLCTLVAIEAAFFAPDGGRTVVAEQGRYIFPAIAALAAIAVAGTFGLGRRRQASFATVLVVAMIGLSYASQLLTLGSFYT